MPIAPKKPCRKYGCSGYQEKDGYCLKHWKPGWSKTGQRSDARYHSGNWQRIRETRLIENPICERCDQKVANTVHHIEPVEEGGDFWDYDNIQALCRDCHEIIHGRKK